MKNYLDLPATDSFITVQLELEPVGTPMTRFGVDEHIIDYTLTETLSLDYEVKLTNPFTVIIELYNKNYNADNETAVIIRRLSVDNISIIPEYTQYAVYDNDHGFTDPTNYLGFNGKWTLTFDLAFYQWLHQARSQGWLIG
jgi:hypothetical protein